MSGTREEKIVESNRLIECTGCLGVQSAFVSKTPRIFVKKQPIATLNDVKPNDNIINFSGTCIFTFKPCLYAPKGTWQKSRETLNAKKQQPLTEISSYLECTQGGKITFVKTPDAWDPPENIVDKAQSRINSAVNSVTKKVTEIAQAASDAIGNLAETAKKTGGFLKNESVSNALKGVSDFVDDVDRKKAGLDVNVANLDIRLNNLRAELKQLLTGQQQELKDLMTIEDIDKTKKDITTAPEKEKKKEEEENKFSQDYFNDETEKTANEFLRDIEKDINTHNENASRLNTTKDYEIKTDEDSADSTRLFTNPATPQVTENEIVSNTVDESKSQTQNIVDQIDSANESVKEFGVKAIDPQSELKVRQSLAVLDDLTSIINKDGIDLDKITNIPTVSETINVYRGELNTSVQAEIDKLLKEIEYTDKLKRYKEESKDLQKDLDNAAAALDVLGDFDAFIDGIAGKHLGRLADKYKKTFDKLGKNMAQLNTSLKGMSYMAGGFKAGDVITNVPIPKNDGENNEDGDKDGSNLAGNIFGSLDDVLNDRNEEPKILRIYAVYAQDPKEGEEYKKGDILETIAIPPDIRVDLIIQSNGMANGSIVDLDLQERSFHYEPLEKKSSSTRDGLFEDIVLNGASPDFENGGSYDLTDPNYALDSEGNRTESPLEDKTIIKFTSRLPVEELEEESLEA